MPVPSFSIHGRRAEIGNQLEMPIDTCNSYHNPDCPLRPIFAPLPGPYQPHSYPVQEDLEGNLSAGSSHDCAQGWHNSVQLSHQASSGPIEDVIPPALEGNGSQGFLEQENATALDRSQYVVATDQWL